MPSVPFYRLLAARQRRLLLSILILLSQTVRVLAKLRMCVLDQSMLARAQPATKESLYESRDAFRETVHAKLLLLLTQTISFRCLLLSLEKNTANRPSRLELIHICINLSPARRKGPPIQTIDLPCYWITAIIFALISTPTRAQTFRRKRSIRPCREGNSAGRLCPKATGLPVRHSCCRGRRSIIASTSAEAG